MSVISAICGTALVAAGGMIAHEGINQVRNNQKMNDALQESGIGAILGDEGAARIQDAGKQVRARGWSKAVVGIGIVTIGGALALGLFGDSDN